MSRLHMGLLPWCWSAAHAQHQVSPTVECASQSLSAGARDTWRKISTPQAGCVSLFRRRTPHQPKKRSTGDIKSERDTKSGDLKWQFPISHLWLCVRASEWEWHNLYIFFHPPSNKINALHARVQKEGCAAPLSQPTHIYIYKSSPAAGCWKPKCCRRLYTSALFY